MTYEHWNLRDLVVPPNKEENALPALVSTWLLILKTFKRWLRESMGCELLV